MKPNIGIYKLLIGVLLLLNLSSAMAQKTYTGDDDGIIRCIIPDTPLEKDLQLRKLQEEWLQAGNSPNTTTITIPVAFHVIRYSDGTANVTDQQINDQIDVLNSSYANTNFTFSLHSIERVNNDQWVNADLYSAAEAEMKQALAIDPAHVLNFYTNDLPGGGLGYARFPWDFPENSYMHGVVCDYASLPGGSIPNYNDGDTGVHEIGHYVGLWHTFENGCDEPGDEVDDTPYEDSPAYGCPAGRNTCPDPDPDPIHNFMDYTYDSCMDHFTSGQSDRMDVIMPQYRPSIFPVQVTVDQRRESNEQLTGTQVGRWENSIFVNYTVPIPPFDFIDGSIEALRGMQERVFDPSEKYNRWIMNLTNDDPDVRNHHEFEITSDISNLTSRFKQTHEGVTLQNNLLNAPGMNPADDEIAFKDPWLIDYADPAYGDNERNQGMRAPFKNRLAPFSPDYNTSYNGDVYMGVFLDQDPQLTPTYYSVQAPTQSVTVNGKQITFDVESWSATGADITSPYSNPTPVIFRNANAVVTANLKGRRTSDTPDATANNNGFKMSFFRDGIFYSARTQLFYEDRGNIYDAPQDASQQWEKDFMVAQGSSNLHLRAPASGFLHYYSPPDIEWTALVWDAFNTTTQEHSVQYRRLSEYGALTSTLTFPTGPTEFEPHPVVSGYITGSPIPEIPTATVVYRGSYYTPRSDAYLFLWFPEESSEAVEVPNTGVSADFPTLDNLKFSSSEYVPYYFLAWQEDNGIHYVQFSYNPQSQDVTFFESTRQQLNEGYSNLYDNTHPSLAVPGIDNSSPVVVWQAMQSGKTINPVVCFRQKQAEGWGVLEVFLTNNTSARNPVVTRYPVGEDHNIAIAYQEADGAINYTIGSDGTWMMPPEPPIDDGVNPALTSVEGTPKIAWTEYQTSPYRIQAGDLMGGRHSPLSPPHSRRVYFTLEETFPNIQPNADMILQISDPIFFNNGIPETIKPQYRDTLLRGSNAFVFKTLAVTHGNSSLQIPVQVTAMNIRVTPKENRSIKSFLRLKLKNADNNQLLDTIRTYQTNLLVGDTLVLLDTFNVDLSAFVGYTILLEGETFFDKNAVVHFAEVYDLRQSTPQNFRITSTGEAASSIAARQFGLLQNYPNPFNPETAIEFTLPATATVRLDVFDITGRHIKTQANVLMAAGEHSLVWMGEDDYGNSVASGVYFYRIQAGAFTAVKKMMLLR